MGPISSFKSSYDYNISKKRKPKHKPFSNDRQNTVSGDIPTMQLSDELRSKIQNEALIERKLTKRRVLTSSMLVTALFLLTLVFVYNRY